MRKREDVLEQTPHAGPSSLRLSFEESEAGPPELVPEPFCPVQPQSLLALNPASITSDRRQRILGCARENRFEKR